MSFWDFCGLQNGKAGPGGSCLSAQHLAGKERRGHHDFKVILSYTADLRPALPIGDLKIGKQTRQKNRKTERKVGRTENKRGVRGGRQEQCLGSLYCLFFRDLSFVQCKIITYLKFCYIIMSNSFLPIDDVL